MPDYAIQLTQGYSTIVDSSLIDEPLACSFRDGITWNGTIRQCKWFSLVAPASNTIYAIAAAYGSKVCRSISLHRLITQAPPDMCVDHINGNGLDNRRCNLRLCSAGENNRNKRSTGEIPYKGVSRQGDGFRVSISVDGVRYLLGTYVTAEAAAYAYNIAAESLHGEFAQLNDVSPVDIDAFRTYRASRSMKSKTSSRKKDVYRICHFNKRRNRWIGEVVIYGAKKQIGSFIDESQARIEMEDYISRKLLDMNAIESPQGFIKESTP